MLASPAITLTDYAIALEATFFALWLFRFGRTEQAWAVAFLSTAIAAGLGGTVHGFVNTLPLSTQILLWQGVILNLGIAGTAIILATAWDTLKGGRRRWIEAIALLKLGLSLPLAITHLSFTASVIDYSISMLIVLGLRWDNGLSSASSADRWTKMGVGLSAIAILPLVVFNVFQAGIVWPHPEVQYHLIQMMALYSFFRAACSGIHPSSKG